MDWQRITKNKLFSYFKRKNVYPLLPILTFILGGWLGMLTTPIVGVFCIALSIYLALVIYFPWEKISWKKFKICCDYLIPAIITILIVWPFWNKLVSIFPITDPYKQPLQIGKADIDVTVEPNGEIGGGLRSFAGLGSILLVKDDNSILVEMEGVAARKQIENGQMVYWSKPELDIKDESVNKPICRLAEAERAVIWFERLPPKSKIIKGEVAFTFNSSVHLVIPIPPQTMENDVIIIQDVRKYFKKRN